MRRGIVCCVGCVTLLLAGCDEPKREFEKQSKADGNICLEDVNNPVEAIAACTRLIDSVGNVMSSAHARYHRAYAFGELGEEQHMKVDLQLALRELDPNSVAARDAKELLQIIEEKETKKKPAK